MPLMRSGPGSWRRAAVDTEVVLPTISVLVAPNRWSVLRVESGTLVELGVQQRPALRAAATALAASALA